MNSTLISNVATFQEQSCKATTLSVFANFDGVDGLENDTATIRALCEWAKLAPSPLAVQAGLAATTVLRPYKGEATTRISAPTWEKLKAAFPAFPGWGAPEPDFPEIDPTLSYVPIRVLPSYAGMGGGGTGDGDLRTAMLPRSLIQDQLRGRPTDFELIDVRGDSMMPDFQNGDQILIDRRDRDPRQPGPFALFDGDGYVLKLVERVPGRRGWYRVFSANPRYSEYEIEEEYAQILGRPVWFARQL